MKRERAKEILSVHRAGLDNELDPEVLEAYRMLETDPELAAWLEEDRRFDARFREALGEHPVPERPASMGRWPRRRWWLTAAAAALVVFAGIVGLQDRASRHNWRVQHRADFRDAMALYAAGGYFQLDTTGDTLADLQSYMAGRAGLTGEDLARAFTSALPMGCKVIEWRDRQVSLYCFANVDNDVVHAFLIPAADLDPAVAAGLMVPRRLHGLETGGWIAGETAYLLVGSEPHISIEPFLGIAHRRLAWQVAGSGLTARLHTENGWPMVADAGASGWTIFSPSVSGAAHRH